jgi:Penicillin binding protein transpeptidase domain
MISYEVSAFSACEEIAVGAGLLDRPARDGLPPSRLALRRASPELAIFSASVGGKAVPYRRSTIDRGWSASLSGERDRVVHAALVLALGAAMTLMRPIEAHRNDVSLSQPAYVLIDAATERVLDARWDDLERPVPVGSLIKPFTALAYADTHRFTYPTFACRGSADGCWLPAGHGRVGIAEAVALSCNAYFRQLAQRTAPDALVARLQLFGMRADLAAATPAAMVGYGDALKIAPAAVMRGYLELVSRAAQPGVSPLVEGMRASARTGTGRGVGAAIGGADALVKTGTAPCSHSPRATADGYTIVVYPADRPRVVLLMQAHGRTGAETAVLAGERLTSALGTR